MCHLLRTQTGAAAGDLTAAAVAATPLQQHLSSSSGHQAAGASVRVTTV